MAVNIVFPESKGNNFRIGMGTKIFDAETGHEIKDIASANISIEPDNIVYVTLKIPLSNTSLFFGNSKSPREYDEGHPKIEPKA